MANISDDEEDFQEGEDEELSFDGEDEEIEEEEEDGEDDGEDDDDDNTLYSLPEKSEFNEKEALKKFKAKLKDEESSNGTGKKEKFKNKQRVLVFSSHGINSRIRHLMNDVRTILPHSKKEVKMEKRDTLDVINEICELKSCNNCIYFDVKKGADSYMWISKVPNGPSAKFLITNIHTLEELKLIGNCLQGSRPIVIFDKNFDSEPHWKLMKELLSQVFGTPRGHPNSKPFVDHALSFYLQDNRIWFRNYQIVETDIDAKSSEPELMEIGPRFVLEPVRMFAGSFGGPTLYQNTSFVSPYVIKRQQIAAQNNNKYKNRILHSSKQMEKMNNALNVPLDHLDVMYEDK